MVAILDSSRNISRREVRGDNADEVLVEYNLSDWRYFHADERGSTIAWSDPAGTIASVLTYDEYGSPAASNPGYFQYTGQMWLSYAGNYNFKNRNYSPPNGRFMQTDPTGAAGGINLYVYALNNPVNLTDPLGLDSTSCTGSRLACQDETGLSPFLAGGFSGDSTGGIGGVAFKPPPSGGVAPWIQDCLNGGSCIPDLSSPPSTQKIPLNYAALTPAEQMVMNALLSSSEFKYKSGYAFNLTQILHLEHGFFIWHNSDGSFTLSKVYTGLAFRMGDEFARDALAGHFFATFHAHWGWGPGALGPSGLYNPAGLLYGGDLFFDQRYGAIGILRNYNGKLIYGH